MDAPSRGGEVRQAEVFENERYMPLMGWAAKFLLPTDRDRFSVGRNDTEGGPDFPVLRLPAGVSCDTPFKNPRAPVDYLIDSMVDRLSQSKCM